MAKQDVEVLPEIGSLFVVHNLRAEWRIRQLEEVLVQNILPDHIPAIFGELEKLSDDFPEKVIELLSGLTNVLKADRDLHIAESRIKKNSFKCSPVR